MSDLAQTWILMTTGSLEQYLVLVICPGVDKSRYCTDLHLFAEWKMWPSYVRSENSGLGG